MDFEYDVFISYTHLDNKPLSKDEGGWISRFHYSFNIRLAQLLGRVPKTWRDNKLQGNDEFSDEIIAKLNKTRVLLAVISPAYLNSQWCRKELEHFIKAAEKSNIGLRIGNKSRVFKVIKTHVPYDRHPDELRGLTGYAFCEADENDRSLEFNPDKGSGSDIKYFQRLNDVACDVCKLIHDIDHPGDSGTGYRVTLPGKTVYLAETTSDLFEDRENIRRDLRLQGYTILPDGPLPYLLKDGKFTHRVREYLERCKLSIHLIGKQYGLVPEGEERSIIQLQEDLAASAASQCKNGPLTRLIWMPMDIDEKTIDDLDDRQKKYISVLKNEAPRVPGTDVLNTSLEDFKTIIRDTLEKINKPPDVINKPTVITKSPASSLWVYLVCDRQDRESVKLLDDCLYEQGFEVKPTFFYGSETERREMHKDRLCVCDALLIYYDNANEFWLHSKLNDLRKALGYGRTRPIKNCAIFIGGKKTEHKERFRTHEAVVIKNYGPFSCNLLSPFISQLRKGNGGPR